MWAYALIDPTVYATPTIITVIVFFAVFSALVLGFRSIRKHTKSVFTVYGILALVGGLLVFQAYDAALGPTHIGYDYTLNTNTFKPDTVNQFHVTSGTNGIRPTNYYLVLSSKNATFTTDNPQDYVQVDNTTIKIPFTFKEAKPATQNRPVFFEISQNSTGFSIDCAVEAAANANIIVTTWTGTMQCDYNAKLNSYTVGNTTRTSV